MFISDGIVFLELHKTACTQIRELLLEVVGGTLEGKHNKASPHLFRPGRAFFGSVRNPWDWYVSLWAYGCDHRGDLFTRATAPRRIRGHGWTSHPLKALRSLLQDYRRDPEIWSACYTDASDDRAFRRWLGLVLGGRLPPDVLTFGGKSILAFAGLMTYRYVNLFCHDPPGRDGYDGVRDIGALENHEHSACFITHFIRQECLEDDLIAALGAAGQAVSPVVENRIRSTTKTNTSSRKRPTAQFYTPETIDLVYRYERLIIDRFSYSPPT